MLTSFNRTQMKEREKERERVGEKNQAPTYDSLDLNEREKERGTRIIDR